MFGRLRVKDIYFISIFFSILPFLIQDISAEEYISSTKFKNYQKQELITSNKNQYLLGPGDSIYINFAGIEIFSSIYVIDPDGFLYLPELKYVLAEGKTLEELLKLLKERYQDYIINPDLDLLIYQYRPVNVVIHGEVNKPGLYTLKYNSSSTRDDSKFNLNKDISSQVFDTNKDLNTKERFTSIPRVFEALQLTKGITNYADLSKIQIIRKNSDSNGGGKVTTTLDFLSLLKDGNQTMNIRLMDGDTIIVPKGEKMIKDQILNLNKSNLTPEIITVYVSGNVAFPGALEIKQGSSLIQAIYKAGGEKYFSGKVKHLRFNTNGKTEKNTFNLNLNAKVNSKRNPILLDGDIVHINRTLIGKTTEAVQNVANPILSSYAIINIFN